MQAKIISLDQISQIAYSLRSEGRRIVHCHGVFDLLHPGHLRHLKAAKERGDCLVVSLTPDRFVNKGPQRPVFPEDLRLEQMAALDCVDYVVLNDSPDAESIIRKIRPNFYAKGSEYSDATKDITKKISVEESAVRECGGEPFYTEDIVFSSSKLINQFLDSDAKRIAPFMMSLKEHFSYEEIIEKIEALASLKVLVVGDAIIDQYQYVEPLGQSGKGVHLTACCLEEESFLGGSLIIANHVASFARQVTLLSAVGQTCPYVDFIRNNLNERMEHHFVTHNLPSTLVKKRYVLKDGRSITKLFETYSSNKTLLDEKKSEEVISFIQDEAKNYDLVLVSDFGNGFTNTKIVEALCKQPKFLALNTQVNSGNRGYHVVTHYNRADFISLNEPEIRLAVHDRESSIENVISRLADLMHCKMLSATQGVKGVLIHDACGQDTLIPALTSTSVDRVGAGDSYFALSSLCAAKGYAPLLTAFLGSVAAAINVQIIGNKEAINKVGLCKYLARLMK